MGDGTNGHVISREQVEMALSGKANGNLKSRIDALEFQAEQCERFFNWPALIESLRADAAALRAAMSTKT